MEGHPWYEEGRDLTMPTTGSVPSPAQPRNSVEQETFKFLHLPPKEFLCPSEQPTVQQVLATHHLISSIAVPEQSSVDSIPTYSDISIAAPQDLRIRQYREIALLA